MSLIPYGRQTLEDDDIAEVLRVLNSDFWTQGPEVEAFENDFARFVGSKYAIAVNNGTAALHLAALSLGVNESTRVLCTTNSFVASSNCILYCGGNVDFVDICPNTLCLDLNLVEDTLRKQPGVHSGIIAVNFAGYPIVRSELKTLADKYGLWIIEDSCHALGATYQTEGQSFVSGNGNHSDISTFSFHPVKHIALGEGGMITTSNEKLYNYIKKLRTHGITKDPREMTQVDGGWYYQMQVLGYNYRIPDILCALGRSQLKRIDKNLQSRRQVAQRYFDELRDLDLILPFRDETAEHAYHLFVVQTKKRNQLYDYLKSKDILTQVHYIPIHTQPYYVEKFGKVRLPNSEKYYSQALSLPMYHGLTEEDQTRVIQAIRLFFNEG